MGVATPGLLHLGKRSHALHFLDADAGAVTLPAALFDLDERELTGAVLNISGGMTTWPDATGNTAGAVDSEGGAFTIGSDHGHSTVTAHFDDSGDEGGDGVGPRPVVSVTFPDPDEHGDIATVLYMVTLGADALVDGSEMCPLTFSPGSGNNYEDTFVYDADRASSQITGYDFGTQTGGPQVGDTYIVTRVHTADAGVPGHLPLSHIDGFEATPQTDYSGTSGDISGPDVMIANYPGGGYCLAGRWRRIVAYPGRLTAAQRLLARQQLAAQALEDEITVTLYDESTIDPSVVTGTVLAPNSDPYAGAEVYLIDPTSYATLATAITGTDGSYATAALPFGTEFTVAVHPTAATEAITYPRVGTPVGYANDATTYTVDGTGDPIDIGALTMLESIDPTADADLVESWDSDDLSSLTVSDGRVTSWAAQQVGRPAFELAAGLGPNTGVRTLDGANLLGFTGESPEVVMTAAADSPASGGQTIIIVGVRDEGGPEYPAFNSLLRFDASPLMIWYSGGANYVDGAGNQPPLSGNLTASYATLGDGGFVSVYTASGAALDRIASSLNDAVYGGNGTSWSIDPTWTDLSLVGDDGYTWAVRYVARIARAVSLDDAAAMCSYLTQTMLPDD